MNSLKFQSVFDIIGPVMIGPSSSHTAGAVRIGKIVSSIFGEEPKEVEFQLFNSFAKTYRGHGTDLALVAGILGMDTDDPRIPDSLKIAHERGIRIVWSMNTPTIIIVHQDVPGMIAHVTEALSRYDINIAQMNVTREKAGEKAIMIIEVDSRSCEAAIEDIRKIPHLHNVNFFK